MKEIECEGNKLVKGGKLKGMCTVTGMSCNDYPKCGWKCWVEVENKGVVQIIKGLIKL